MTYPWVLGTTQVLRETCSFSLPKCLRGISLLKSIFFCMLEMVWNASRNTANSHLQLPPCLVLSLWAVLPVRKCKRSGSCSCCLWRSQAQRGSCWLLGTVSQHRFQQHLPLAAPVGKVCIRLSALLEQNVNICMFYQSDQASNIHLVGEEMREDRKNWGRDLLAVNLSFDVWDRAWLVLMFLWSCVGMDGL